MSFIARENRQSNYNEATNHSYGRMPQGQIDLSQQQKKMTEQQSYKQYLQQQMIQKQKRKKQQQEKRRREDEKVEREINEINRKEALRKQQQKNKKQKAFQNAQPNPIASPKPSKQKNIKDYKTSRVMMGNLGTGLKQQQQNRSNSPKLNFANSYKYQQYQYQPPPTTSHQPRRQYQYDDYESPNEYYEQRIRRHKQQMNEKLDQLFHHIHSTKDNINADEQIDKIKRRLRTKQLYNIGGSQLGLQNKIKLDFDNKLYNVPKKHSQFDQYSRSPKQGKSRALDYQSSSKFRLFQTSKNGGDQLQQSRSKSRVQSEMDDFYSLPRKNQSYGRQGKVNNKQALDQQIAKTLGEIDEYQGYLKKVSNEE